MGPIKYIEGKMNQDFRTNIDNDLTIQGFIDSDIVEKLKKPSTTEETQEINGRVNK